MSCNNTKNTNRKITGSLLPENSKAYILLYIFFIMVAFSGCAANQILKVDTINIDNFSPYELPDGSKIYPASIDDTVPDVDILAINDEIKALLNQKIKKIRNPAQRIEKLSEILVSKIMYDTAGDAYGVQTAQETFDSGTGNCLSFTNLFVAMARYSGLRPRFSEIPTLPNWTRDGEILFFTRHIGASVDILHPNTDLIQLQFSDENNRVLTLDSTVRYNFAPSMLATGGHRVYPFGFITISDNRAFAQYYNNMGSKKLAEGNGSDAFRYFVKAIKTDPKLSYAWSNLGVIYRKNNQVDAAEAAYLQGLAVTRGSRDTSALSIMNNLTNLYDMTGETEKAGLYKSRIASFREKNPYYQYLAGKTAFDDSLYEKSVGLYKKAIRLKYDEHLFYYSLALAYLKIGEVKKAEINMSNAVEYSWDERRKIYYENLLDIIKNDN